MGLGEAQLVLLILKERKVWTNDNRANKFGQIVDSAE